MEEAARVAGNVLRRRRGLACGGRARGRAVFPPLYHFLLWPGAQARFSRLASWAVGGASRERERVGGGRAEWGIPADRCLIPVASRLDSRPPVIDLLKNIPQRRIFSLFLWALAIGRFARGRFSCLGVEPDVGTLTRLLTISISWRLINPNIPRSSVHGRRDSAS